VYLRSLVVKNDAVLELRHERELIKSFRKGHVQPSEMISVNLGPKELEGLGPGSALEFSLV
jgi:hypothetical protein